MIDEDVLIRDAVESDFEMVLRLNEAFVHFLSPLTLELLAGLASEAAYFRVAELDNQVCAFLIGFTPGASYASPNYLWFDRQFDDFAYIDRIVVSERSQGQSVGAKLYDDFAGFARERGLAKLACEFNIKPLNEGSAKFHRKYGFKEVGQQQLEREKQVSLQVFQLS